MRALRLLPLAALAAIALVPAAGDANHQPPKNGCTSKGPQSGTLTSPPFTVNSTGAQVTLDTWWEIESVNPSTFDLMTIEASVDGGSFSEITRLNPAESVAGGSDDVPLSNIGLQARPDWEIGGAGATLPFTGPAEVRLRFHFDTGDVNFNGFRGWGVDNVQVIDGSITVLSESFDASTIPSGWDATGFWRIPLSPEDTLIDDRINPPLISLDPADNGVGVGNLVNSNGYAWFGDGATGTYCGADFALNLALDTPFAARETSTDHTVLASVEGASQSQVVWSVEGANFVPPTVAPTTPLQDGTSQASISWRGANAGDDFLTTFLDLNSNQQQDPGEPADFASVNWSTTAPPAPPAPPADTGTPPPPPAPTTPSQQEQRDAFPPEIPQADRIEQLPDPEPFEEINIQTQEGAVFVQLPRRRGARASQAPSGFIPLTRAVQVPVGSIVETSQGKIALESAANRGGSRTQSAQFFDGRFEMRQPRARRSAPVTEMVLKGGSFRGCPRARQSASWSRANDAQRRRRSSRVRRLWGSGRGRFRTRGRYSSATVRGTTWLVEDRCDGTLTRLPRRPRTSVVDVRDSSRRRTIRLRAGRSYLARPRAARRR